MRVQKSIDVVTIIYTNVCKANVFRTLNEPHDRMVERPNRGSAANPFRTATKAYSDTTQKIELNRLNASIQVH